MIRRFESAFVVAIVAGTCGCGLMPVAEPTGDAAIDLAVAWDAMSTLEVAARGSQQGEMTCDAAIAIAIVNNFDLRSKRAERGIADAQLFAAGLLRDPELDLRALSSGVGEANLLFEVLQDFRQRSHRRAAAAAAASVIDLEIADAEWRVATAVEAAYLAATRAAAQHELLTRQRTAATVESVAALRARDVGEVGTVAVLEAESIVADLEVELLTAESRRAEALFELSRLLGFPAGLQIELASPGGTDAALNRTALLAALPASRFDLRILEREHRVAEAEWALARGEQVTLPSLGPALESDADGVAFGIDIAWTVPLFSGNRGAIAEAAARVKLKGSEYLAGLHDATSQLDAAIVAAELVGRRRDTWQNELLPRSRRVLDFVRAGVQSGQVPVLEGSRRLREALTRERLALDAEFDHREALLAVRRAAGPVSSP